MKEKEISTPILDRRYDRIEQLRKQEPIKSLEAIMTTTYSMVKKHMDFIREHRNGLLHVMACTSRGKEVTSHGLNPRPARRGVIRTAMNVIRKFPR